MKTCKYPDCPDPHFGRGWCRKHYTQWYRHGAPTHLRSLTIDERLQTSWQEDANGCWIWTGAKRPNGYGGISWQNKAHLAHRLMFTRLVRDLDRSEILHHTCQVKRCVNPDHLEVLGMDSHAAEHRALGTLRPHGHETHCPQGHPYDEVNTYRRNGGRYCRTCMRERSRRAYERKRQAAA